jgi:tetratricopeptide (TPR) repeat protein
MSSDEDSEYDDMDDGGSYDDEGEGEGEGDGVHVPNLDPMLEDAYNTYEDDLDLDDISEELVDQTAQVNLLETRLKRDTVTKEDISLAKSQLPTIFGNLEDLQYELDGLSLESEADKLKRKQLLVEIEALFVRIQTLQDLAQIQVAKLSDELRTRGNDLFKAGKHAEAIKTYDDAISLDSLNAVLFTNRALAKQKLERIDEAILDARRAVTIDTSTLKGYVILIKCLNSKGDFASSTVALDSVHLAYETRPEVVELRALTAAGAKESGNAHFKAGRLDEAIGSYTVAIKNDPSNHLLYSNRSAAYQSKKAWDKGAADGEACLRLCESFPKAYVHLGRCQVQLKRWGDALATVAKANAALGAESEELRGIQPQLKEIVESVEAGQTGRRAPGSSAASSSSSAASDRQRAEAVKEKGNECYKEGEYQEAIRFYSQAIAICPSDGSYYGNRAAAWHMIREFKRAMADCVEGLKLEKTPGSLDKLRLRQANAQANLGDIAGAISLLEEAATKTPESAANFDKTVHQLRAALMHIDAGNESLGKSEFSRAKRLFQLASTQGGVGDNPAVRLGCARCHLGLGEFDDASREAQKVISTTGGAGQVSVDAYLCRAEALQATGSTDLASKHLSAALQMDPDNQAIQIKVKTLRRIINETTRVRAEVDEHMNKSAYDKAVLACADGLLIDKDSKKLMSEMHYRCVLLPPSTLFPLFSPLSSHLSPFSSPLDPTP